MNQNNKEKYRSELLRLKSRNRASIRKKGRFNNHYNVAVSVKI